MVVRGTRQGRTVVASAARGADGRRRTPCSRTLDGSGGAEVPSGWKATYDHLIADPLPYPDPPLGGATFRLRPFVHDDFEAAVRFATEPATARWVPPLPASDPAGVIEFFELYRRNGDLLHLVIADLGNDAYLGEVMVAVGEHRVGEFGVGVVAEARCLGIATEAFCTFVNWTAATLDIQRMQVLVAPENGAALRIAELAGFEREGLLRSYWEHDGKRSDAVMLSQLPTDLGSMS